MNLYYMLSKIMECVLEQGICKSFIVRPVGGDTGTAGGCHPLIGFLGLESFLSSSPHHEVITSVVRLVVQKESG